jgi:Uncharacterized membrane-associated protein
MIKEYIFIAMGITFLLLALLPITTPVSSNLISFIAKAIESYSYIAIFLLMFGESASLPIPSEVILPFTGFLVWKGVISFHEALIITTIASIFGAMFDYYIGYKVGRPVIIKLLKWLKVREERLISAEKLVQRRGFIIILVSRLLPGLRSIISIPAGMFRMRISLFILFTLIGVLFFNALLIYIGILTGIYWEEAIRQLDFYLIKIFFLLISFIFFI